MVTNELLIVCYTLTYSNELPIVAIVLYESGVSS